MMGAPNMACAPWSPCCLVESQVQDLHQRPQLWSSVMWTRSPQFDLPLLEWILIYMSSSKCRLFWQLLISRSDSSLTWPLWVYVSILLITGPGLLLPSLLPFSGCSRAEAHRWSPLPKWMGRTVSKSRCDCSTRGGKSFETNTHVDAFNAIC